MVKDAAFSPRLGLTWDLKGDGTWVVNSGFARYVTGISTALVDAGSAGGRTATFSYYYQGPDINTGAGPYLTTEQALPILFDWFFANGGTTRTTRTAPSIPGVTTKVGSGVKSPNSDEYTIGLARTIGSRGAWRADYIYRTFRDFYGDYRDISTGKVTDPTGRVYDLTIVRNTNAATRTYKGVNLQASYRFGTAWQVGGNYTLSWARGNFTGEDTGSGPLRFSGNDMPEYRQASWNYPTGYNPNDQRHKVRAWFSYMLPVSPRLGKFDLGLLQRVDSGTAFSPDGTIDSRPYVTNPGYQTPVSSVTYYFGERGGGHYDIVFRTDLSLVWTARIPQLRSAELFFRGVVTNVFNNAQIIAADGTILTRSNNSAYTAFNPFLDTPVEGVNWAKGPDYGQPTGTGDYQAPREFSFSVGIRF